MAQRSARARQKSQRRFSRNHRELVIIPLVLTVYLVVFFSSGPRFTGFAVQKSAGLDQFAQCLTQNGAVLYGTYNSLQTKAQKELLGESVRYINYVECYPTHIAGRPELCQQAGVEASPTWIINGEKYLGYQSLLQLSVATGCR